MKEDEENRDDEIFREQISRQYLRKSLKENIEEIRDKQEDIGKIKSDQFNISLKKTNAEFRRAEHTRELTLDAVAMRQLAIGLKKQAMNLDASSKKYDFRRLEDKLKSLFCDGKTPYIDWIAVGSQASFLMVDIAPVTTMHGPVAKEVRKRKVAQKKEAGSDDEAVILRPSEVKKAGENNQEKEEAMSSRVKSLFQKIYDKTTGAEDSIETSSKPIDLLRLLVHPTDIIQTVENFFDFSFLIKEKVVAEELSSNGLPVALAADPDQLDKIGHKKQMVLSLNIGDLAELTDILYPKNSKIQALQCFELNRDDELYKADSVEQQIELLLQKNKKVKSS